MMLQPGLNINDKKARIFIFTVSLVIFITVLILTRVKIQTSFPFDVHIFAAANAIINSMVAVMLIAGLFAVRTGRYLLHKRIMMTAIILSVFFLISYIAHHLFAGETRFGDTDHNGVVSDEEKAAAGNIRYVYYILLLTHIPLAGIIVPFILFTAYRGLTGEYIKHKRLSRLTWPLWLYVAISGVLVYLMISPYYS